MEHSLTKRQKESIFLLQIGTFLEYFDLMLYVHMAVVLNELFFPPTDPKTASILAAFAFCSTYVLRPFGALIFGHIGDNYGRKPTVIITTTIMAICCLIMANIPTYATIGISAAIVVSVLRIIQGMTSMGEIMGAHIYVTEITNPPSQYPAVSSIAIAAAIGSMVALGVATLTTRLEFNWRLAFWIGACVAIVGSIARTHLRETPEFADAKRKMEKAINEAAHQGLKKPAELLKSTNLIFKEKLKWISFANFTAIYSGRPFAFYFAYIYFVPILKNSYGYTSADVISHNFLISVIDIFGIMFFSLCSRKIYPLFVSKVIGLLFLFVLLATPLLLESNNNHYVIFLVQILITILGLRGTPSDPIFIKHFPVFRRFTAVTFSYALSRAVMYVIISFGLVYLTECFGYYGIWVIGIPIALLWIRAIYYYESLEKEIGNYPLKGEWQVR